jgi:cellulose synthase operon protein YhjQ
MDTQQTDIPDEPLSETPEDVAILYSWANLHGAKYRDFSASRREYRAQVRHRAAEEMRQAELEAKAEAEAAAQEAERVAREAERAARSTERMSSGVDRDRALREAEDAVRRASAERVEAARRAEAAALAEAVARREEREIAEAHASAQRQAANWNDSEMRRRALAGPQPVPAGPTGDPYEHQEHLFDTPPAGQGPAYSPNRALEYTQPKRYRDETAEFAPRISGERRAYREKLEVRRRPQGFRPDLDSGIRPSYLPGTSPIAMSRSIGLDPYGRPAADARQRPAYAQPPEAYPAAARPADRGYQDPRYVEPRYPETRYPETRYPDQRNPDPRYPDARATEPRYAEDAFTNASGANPPATPAWLYGATPPPAPAPAPQRPSAVADTLQYSRERVAARWFALKGVFEPGQRPAEPARQREVRVPMLAVFSLAGGVGKTSLLATLGRALSASGEKVLLADTTSHGLLPYYFGASELRTGVVRTFSPPAGSPDAPIHLVSYDVEARVSDRAAQEALVDEIIRNAQGTQRVLLDLNASSGWVIQRLARLNPRVLIPVAPDMNSVISLQTVEKYFQGLTDLDGRPMQPLYVLNQFDATLPLHLDVREVLRRQLGDRLLPFSVRRAPAVSEALAEGMTVVDYAPESPVTEDYRNIAGWLRSLAAPANPNSRNSRWSER